MKLFVVSDIHSFYEPLITALDKAGFDKNNKDHWLISCGDCFDRGPGSVELLHYLMSLDRKILIKGNHDLLLEECCLRGFPYSHDKHNGTTRTIQDISKMYSAYDFAQACESTYAKTARYRELLVDYFETEKYIFVHSWIPLKTTYLDGASKPWHQKYKEHEYMEDWRNANSAEWEEAMWSNPFERYFEDLNKTGKTIVFGHWHCSTGHAHDHNSKITEFEADAIWEPWFGVNAIGIDRCTAHTGEVNVLVLEDSFLIK